MKSFDYYSRPKTNYPNKRNYIKMDFQEMEDRLEKYSKIENLLVAYTREVLGESYTGTNGFTVEKLIEQSREFRKMNGDIGEQRRQGYQKGYEAGLKMAELNGAITLDKLAVMTVQELANLIGGE